LQLETVSTREEGGTTPDEGCATSAMWPAVGHGRRPAGRRVPTRWFDLTVMPERERRQ